MERVIGKQIVIFLSYIRKYGYGYYFIIPSVTIISIKLGLGAERIEIFPGLSIVKRGNWGEKLIPGKIV